LEQVVLVQAQVLRPKVRFRCFLQSHQMPVAPDLKPVPEAALTAQVAAAGIQEV
jgi:hypothetical protein